MRSCVTFFVLLCFQGAVAALACGGFGDSQKELKELGKKNAGIFKVGDCVIDELSEEGIVVTVLGNGHFEIRLKKKRTHTSRKGVVSDITSVKRFYTVLKLCPETAR